MPLEVRKTGISVIGDLPWGAHFSSFYETKQDLLDILVPYFKTGLENKEFCLWIISNSELLTEDEAMSALRNALPDLDRYVAERSLEIVSHDDWFLNGEPFDLHKVVNRFKEKLDEALARDYAGMRINGSPAWLHDMGQKELSKFEAEFDKLFGNKRMIASCTYPLATVSGHDVFDVARIHQFTIARRQGEWEVIQSPEPIQARAEIKRLNKELHRVLDRTPEPPAVLRYGVAVLAVIAALIINRLLNINLVGAPAMLFLCALMFSAWYGGVKPSLLAMPLAVLAFAYYFVTPINSWSVDVREIPRLLLFVLCSFFVISLIAAQRRAAESLTQARDVLAGTVEDLRRTNQALRTENTERKQAEALLNATEQEFRAIVESTPDHIARYDREFRRTYVNPALAKAYDLPMEALIGKPMFSIIHDAGLDVEENVLAQIRQRFAAVFETRKSYEFEITLPMPPGRKDYSVRIFPELDLNGSVINVLSIARDITESKRAEEELKKEKEVLEKIFDNIPVMIGFVGEDGVVKLVNPEWERTIGWTLKELQQQNVDIFAEAYPDLAYRQEVLDFVAASTGEWVDLKIKVRDGRVIDAACAVVHLSDGTRVAIAQDITERKRAEERIRATTEQLRALSASVQSAKEEEGTRIARELHDELGSALTSLKWDLERFHKAISESKEQSLLRAWQEKVEAMLRLSETTISTVRRISSELRPSILDDLGLAAAIEWQARQFQTRTGIICHCDCSIEKLDLDREQSTAIFRILQEALTNILRHAQATRVDIVIKEEAGEIVLTVSDNGRGITEDEKSSLQSLGLLGMRERAHLIGGEIDIIAVHPQGTVVTVRVPKAQR